jgi:hypothetical protein
LSPDRHDPEFRERTVDVAARLFAGGAVPPGEGRISLLTGYGETDRVDGRRRSLQSSQCSQQRGLATPPGSEPGQQHKYQVGGLLRELLDGGPKLTARSSTCTARSNIRLDRAASRRDSADLQPSQEGCADPGEQVEAMEEHRQWCHQLSPPPVPWIPSGGGPCQTDGRWPVQTALRRSSSTSAWRRPRA